MAALSLGDLRISGLMDVDNYEIAINDLLPAGDAGVLAPHMDWLSPGAMRNGKFLLLVRSWLLQLDGRNILVDTCVGAHKDRPLRPTWHQREGAEWLAALAAEGLVPEDIDIVLCTHLHPDHVGWNTKLVDGRWVPTFPNARYLVGRKEYEAEERSAATRKPDHFQDSISPVMAAGQMDLVDDGRDLAAGLTLKYAPGHTPGHMCVHATQGSGAIFTGDVIHTPAQLIRPDWSSAFCRDAEQSRQSRRAILEEVADTGRWLIPCHFPDPGWVRIVSAGEGFRLAGPGS